MEEKSDWILIGSGKDNDIRWLEKYSIIEDISCIFNEIESAKKEIYIEDLKDKSSLLKNSLVNQTYSIEDIISLIDPFVFCDKTFDDPDQPNASYFFNYYITRDQKESFLLFLLELNKTLELFKKENRIEEINSKLMTEFENERVKKEERKKEELLEFQKDNELKIQNEAKVIYNKIILSLKNEKKTLDVIGNFLINKEKQQVIYIRKHNNWRSEDQIEKIIVDQYLQKYDLIIVEEKPKDGRDNIPYYGGMQRMKEMGWNQEISEILHSDKITLQHVIELRSMWNKINVLINKSFCRNWV